MQVRVLQQAGYPLTANDLTREEWFDLALVRAALEPPAVCPLTVHGKKKR